MNSVFDHLRDLDVRIQAMSRTESPAELFKALREACRLAAPRGSVFLVRRGRIQGWSAHGYDTEVTEAQREFKCGLDEGWLAALASTQEVIASKRPAGVTGPDFGQPVAAEAVGSAVRIQGKPIAILVAERQEGETPWHPELVGSLVTVAQLRLELDLALRRLQGAPAKRPAEKSAEPQPAQAVEQPAAQAAAPAAASMAEEAQAFRRDEPTALEPAPEPPPQGETDLEAARRYARLVATDIRLYNEEAVVLGRRNGDLGIRLEEHLDRGKETFMRRHGDLGSAGLELLHEAYVQVLAAGDAALIPESVTH